MNDIDPNIIEEPTAGEYGKVYTYSDYLKFEYDHMVELIRGKIFKMSTAPKSAHQMKDWLKYFIYRMKSIKESQPIQKQK